MEEEYIIRELQKFIKIFKKAKVCYQFDRLSDAYIIEISPKELYNEDSFITWENKMINSFIQEFPYRNICFITEDNLIGIKKDFSISGDKYKEEDKVFHYLTDNAQEIDGEIGELIANNIENLV